jgi:hypothetical protein
MIRGQFYWRGVAFRAFRQSRPNLRRQQDYFADFFYWPRRFAYKVVKISAREGQRDAHGETIRRASSIVPEIAT